MKRIYLLFFLISTFVFAPNYSFAKEEVHQVGQYITVGKISSPWLNKLLEIEKNKIYALSKKKGKPKAVVMDGLNLTSKQINRDAYIKKARIESIPIVINKPKKTQLQAIMGAEVKADAVIIVPHKRGEEYEVFLIDEPKTSKEVQACWIGVGPGPGGYWGNGPIGRVINIIDNTVIRNENEIGEFINDAIGCHRCWQVKRADPFIWGTQGQQIDIGFEFNLYYVTSPLPVRKYLTVKTYGKGASPGTLRADNPFHRGYYQNALTVRVQRRSKNWKGKPLLLEDLAPRTDNNSGQVQVTTGKQFFLGGSVGGSNNNTGINFGFNAIRQSTEAWEYRDFSVSQDPNPFAAQWTYWMSAADGAPLKRRDQASGLLTNANLLTMIRELPELAKGSYLKPYLEVVYFADGDETGKQEFCNTVEQYLQDLENDILLKGVKNRVGVLSQRFTVDFSQVDEACARE